MVVCNHQYNAAHLKYSKSRFQLKLSLAQFSPSLLPLPHKKLPQEADKHFKCETSFHNLLDLSFLPFWGHFRILLNMWKNLTTEVGERGTIWIKVQWSLSLVSLFRHREIKWVRYTLQSYLCNFLSAILLCAICIVQTYLRNLFRPAKSMGMITCEVCRFPGGRKNFYSNIQFFHQKCFSSL